MKEGLYWLQAADGTARLIAQRCTACGAKYLPRVALCHSCRGNSFDSATLSNSGTLYTFTVVRTPVLGYPEPYAIGYVDFPEGVRVFAHLKIDESLPFQCDMPVKVDISELKRDANGDSVVGYRFVPVLENSIA